MIYTNAETIRRHKLALNHRRKEAIDTLEAELEAIRAERHDLQNRCPHKHIIHVPSIEHYDEYWACEDCGAMFGKCPPRP